MNPKSVWMTKFKVPNKTLTILREKLPKIITHKWKFGKLLEAPNLLPMKGLFVTKFESNESKVNCQLQNCKKVLNFGGFSLFGDSLNLECFLVQ